MTLARALMVVSLVASIAASDASVAQQSQTEATPAPSRAVPTMQRLTLEPPFSTGLSFSFDPRPTPTFEWLQLPTFEGAITAPLMPPLQLALEEHVAPAVALDCSRTCAPEIEHVLGTAFRLSLGHLSPTIPEAHVFARTDAIRQPTRFATRTLVGVAGLLNF